MSNIFDFFLKLALALAIFLQVRTVKSRMKRNFGYLALFIFILFAIITFIHSLHAPLFPSAG